MEVSSLKYHSFLLLLSIHPLVLPWCCFAILHRRKRKCFCMASRAHFSFGTPTAHTSQYTNTDIFLSSVSSRCWRLLFCLMKTAPLFVLCLMFQHASHFQVLLVILACMLMGCASAARSGAAHKSSPRAILQARPSVDLTPLCHIHLCCLG